MSSAVDVWPRPGRLAAAHGPSSAATRTHGMPAHVARRERLQRCSTPTLTLGPKAGLTTPHHTPWYHITPSHTAMSEPAPMTDPVSETISPHEQERLRLEALLQNRPDQKELQVRSSTSRAPARGTERERRSSLTCPASPLPCPRQDKNILKSTSLAPSLQSATAQLQKAQLEDRLESKLESRPDREELERIGILKDGKVAPGLQAKQEELRKAQLEDSLEKELLARRQREEVSCAEGGECAYDLTIHPHPLAPFITSPRPARATRYPQAGEYRSWSAGQAGGTQKGTARGSARQGDRQSTYKGGSE